MDDTRGTISPFLRRARIGLGVAASAGAVLGTAPGTAAGATEARVRASEARNAPAQPDPNECPPMCAQYDPWVLPGAACPNPNPGDARTIYTRNIVNGSGADVGDVTLQYSAGSRCVRAVASCVGATGYGDVWAYVYKPSTNQQTAGAFAHCGYKAVTPWVNDSGVQQAAHAAKTNGGVTLGLGATPAY